MQASCYVQWDKRHRKLLLATLRRGVLKRHSRRIWPQRKKAKAAQPSESRKTHKDLGDASDAEVISSDDSDKTSPPPPARKPSSQRTSAQKVKTYMLDSEEEEEEEEEDEEKGSRAKKPAPRKTPAKTSAQKKQKPKKGSESEDELQGMTAPSTPVDPEEQMTQFAIRFNALTLMNA